MGAEVREQGNQSNRGGVIYAIMAYSAWGLAPIYFKAVSSVPPLEVLCHRIVWSVVLLIVLVAGSGRIREATRVITNRRILVTLVATTTLIAVNWFTFIWCVANNLVLRASLAYFICPLVTVLLGCVFLRERLRPCQVVSVLLAVGGVAVMVLKQGHVPWMAILLASTFALYGLLRKVGRVEALIGLTLETCLLFPIAAAYLVILAGKHDSAFLAISWRMDALLIMAGGVTALPLLWFSLAAKRVKLSTLGITQYLAPTGQFFVALAYGEQFSRTQAVSFSIIWIALVLYTVDAILAQRSLERRTFR